tara:strand:- start:83 stop:271 length:189 start_codon:yes stop_codon:yes gene_type:complete
MSHPVNDMIADNAIDHVANMPKPELMKMLKDNKVILAPGEDPVDVGIEIYYTELMERPGPHG